MAKANSSRLRSSLTSLLIPSIIDFLSSRLRILLLRPVNNALVTVYLGIRLLHKFLLSSHDKSKNIEFGSSLYKN